MKTVSILSTAVFGLISFSSKAQFFTNTVFNRKAAYMEVFGTGIGATLNYEYLHVDNGIKQGIKGGAGYSVDLFDEEYLFYIKYVNDKFLVNSIDRDKLETLFKEKDISFVGSELVEDVSN